MRAQISSPNASALLSQAKEKHLDKMLKEIAQNQINTSLSRQHSTKPEEIIMSIPCCDRKRGRNLHKASIGLPNADRHDLK